VATGRSDQKTNVLATLTPRESEILKALAGGGANKVIARTFDLTEDAVKFHLKNIYRKLGSQAARRLRTSHENLIP
jgi:LuxR family maltose regulon positive regulatory protein